MALQISWTNGKRGTSHPNCYARAMADRIVPQLGFARCQVLFYHSRTEANPYGKNQPEDTQEYFVSGDSFDDYFSEAVLKEAGKSLLSQWYQYLKDKVFVGALDV